MDSRQISGCQGLRLGGQENSGMAIVLLYVLMVAGVTQLNVFVKTSRKGESYGT